MNAALEIANLKKTYANGFTALGGVDMTVGRGDFFALLGSNGAGKTTIIGIICGLIAKTSGRVRVFGHDQDCDQNAIKRQIGLMPQEFNFNPFEPIEEILINQAGYYGIGRAKARQNAERLLRKMTLWERRKEMARTLSGGMKRRLMLARALMHAPKILILDEPTAGVDIEIRRSIWEYLRQLNTTGMTIILTTHYLEEAEALCRNIMILDLGKVVARADMKTLLAETRQALILESRSPLPENIRFDGFAARRLDQKTLEVSPAEGTTIGDILKTLGDQKIEIDDVRTLQNRLETLFLNLTKKN